MTKATDIMRLEEVVLNGRLIIAPKPKVALRMADQEGVIDEKTRISGLIYMSQDKRQLKEITYQKYKELGSPNYISRINDGTLQAVPLCLVPDDFPVREFD